MEFLGVPRHLSSCLDIDPHASLTDSIGLKLLMSAATAEYISAYGQKLVEAHQKDHLSLKCLDLGWVLESALDVHRSVWDRKSALAFIDMEYYCKTYPGESFFNPERTFGILEPAYRAVLDTLKGHGVLPLVITTGQGYNFVVRIPKKSEVFKELAGMGQVEPSLRYDYSHPSAARGRSVPEDDGRAFDSVGKLMEHLYHEVIRHSYHPRSALPLVIGDISCGNEKREAISFDLSAYANPIHKRSIRCPFSIYSKHMLKADIFGEAAAAVIGQILCVPRRTSEMELPVARVLKTRRSAREAAELAQEISTAIPDQAEGIADLLHDYWNSALYAFHQDFDAVQQDDASTWCQGYDLFELYSIPPCVAQALRYPNPLLLQPTNLQLVVRTLLALGWHSKHIAGLITSKYMRDYGWEVNFMRYDANRWANVWVRMYAGLVWCGTDDLYDLDCASQKNRGEAWMGIRYCPHPGCGFDLSEYKRQLGREIKCGSDSIVKS